MTTKAAVSHDRKFVIWLLCVGGVELNCGYVCACVKNNNNRVLLSLQESMMIPCLGMSVGEIDV